MRPYYAWLVSKGKSPKALPNLQPAKPQIRAHHFCSLLLAVSPNWRSIQLANCRTNSSRLLRDSQPNRVPPPGVTPAVPGRVLSKPKFSKIAFCARHYYFVRAEPLKIAKSASSSTPDEGAGRPFSGPQKRGSRGALRHVESIFQVPESNRISRAGQPLVPPM